MAEEASLTETLEAGPISNNLTNKPALIKSRRVAISRKQISILAVAGSHLLKDSQLTARHLWDTTHPLSSITTTITTTQEAMITLLMLQRPMIGTMKVPSHQQLTTLKSQGVGVLAVMAVLADSGVVEVVLGTSKRRWQGLGDQEPSRIHQPRL